MESSFRQLNHKLQTRMGHGEKSPGPFSFDRGSEDSGQSVVKSNQQLLKGKMKMESIIMEIRDQVGGKDSMLLVEKQAQIYLKAAGRRKL